jgi:peptidyl-tRNA hydrolase, PTH1 family
LALQAQSGDAPAWLIAGLGNPGEEYALTYHNLGFLAIDRIADAAQIRVTRPECQSLAGQGLLKRVPVLLAKPQTYMNLSGPAVKALLTKYNVPLERLVLIYDELALDWGSMRIRPQGSAGGHNGVSSVIRSVASPNFIRIRLDHPVSNMKDYVLAKMRRAQTETLVPLLDETVLAVETIITEGVEKAMAIHNRRAQGAKEEQ